MSDHAKIAIVTPRSVADFASLARLARELAAYHRDDFAPAAEVLARDHGPWFEAVLARTPDGADIGFAGWHTFYMVQSATRGLELQNLYVEPAWRARGAGFLLVRHAAAEALRQDVHVLRIGVRKDNSLAIEFYRRLGCTMLDRGVTWACRLDADGMRRLSGSAAASPSALPAPVTAG